MSAAAGGGLREAVLFSSKDGPNWARSEVVFLDENGLAAVVTEAEFDFRSGKFRGEDVRLLAHDSVSRVSLVRVPLEEGERTTPVELGSSLNVSAGSQLYPSLEGESQASVIVSRESEYEEEPLPFELFRVHNPEGKAFFPGQPLFDSAGRLIAISYRKAKEFGNGNFAFPVEVVKRIQGATVEDGIVQRSWFGVELLPSDPFAIVQRVRPISPAAKAGLVKGDVLVQIGPRRIESYSDAINAFFYLRDDQEVVVKFIRGVEVKEATVKPELVPSVAPSTPATEVSEEEGGS